MYITYFNWWIRNRSIDQQELVYLLSNESIPGWVKIGRTNQVDRRLSELYNTSVPLPFKLEDTIHTNSLKQSSELERSIHSIIDTINPDLRKNTEANRREFFKLSIDQGKQVFNLVSKIMKINPLEFEGDYHGTSIRSNKHENIIEADSVQIVKASKNCETLVREFNNIYWAIKNTLY